MEYLAKRFFFYFGELKQTKIFSIYLCNFINILTTLQFENCLNEFIPPFHFLPWIHSWYVLCNLDSYLIYIQQRIMVQGLEMNILLCKPKYVVLLHSPFIHWKKKGKNYVTFFVLSLMNESGMYSERLFQNVSQFILLS